MYKPSKLYEEYAISVLNVQHSTSTFNTNFVTNHNVIQQAGNTKHLRYLSIFLVQQSCRNMHRLN